MLSPFRLHEPATVREASALLAGLGDDACVYAGGTELLLAMKQGVLRYGHLVNVKPLGLNGVSFDAAVGCLRVGATTTHRTLERSEIVAAHFPVLTSMERRLANVRVRAVGTVGGNLCFAEPHSDLATVLLLHNATATLGTTRGQRIVDIADLFVDAYTTCLGQDELLLEIAVPALPEGAGAAYQKVGSFERPSVGLGAVVVPTPDRTAVAEARIALGCVGPMPIRVHDAERALAGAPLRGATFERALRDAVDAVKRTCHPTDDLYGSSEDKRHVAGVLAERTVTIARDRVVSGREV